MARPGLYEARLHEDVDNEHQGRDSGRTEDSTATGLSGTQWLHQVCTKLDSRLHEDVDNEHQGRDYTRDGQRTAQPLASQGLNANGYLKLDSMDHEDQ